MEDCLTTAEGFLYAGEMSVTVTGRTCQRWSTIEPHNHTYQFSKIFPEGSAIAARNKCRNPTSADDEPIVTGIWCFTTDPSTPWELCSVPICGICSNQLSLFFVCFRLSYTNSCEYTIIHFVLQVTCSNRSF